MRLTIMDFC